MVLLDFASFSAVCTALGIISSELGGLLSPYAASVPAVLTHPNTIRVFDYGVTDEGVFFYVMELLNGRTLGELVRDQGPLPPARAVRIAVPIARALAEAHAKDIVHRDIKPDNIFISSLGGESDSVKVLDFGVARILTRSVEETELTQTGVIIGTPAYMPQEVAHGEPATPASDVFAFGAVLYFMLTGRRPFEGETFGAILVAQLAEAVIPPSHTAGRKAACLDEIILKCLRTDSYKRYRDASRVLDALVSTERFRQLETTSPRISQGDLWRTGAQERNDTPSSADVPTIQNATIKRNVPEKPQR